MIFVVIIAVICTLIGMLAIAATNITKEVEFKGVIGVVLVLFGFIMIGASMFEIGKSQERMPNLEAHACKVSLTVSYGLGEDYRPTEEKISEVLSGRAKCKGSISSKYPGNEPIKNPLK